MKNKIWYLSKFQDSGTLPESTEYYEGNLNSAKVFGTLSRDQWNNLYKQGKISLSQIPRKYQSWIEGENSDFKQNITNAIDDFGTKYVAPTLATTLSFNPIIGGAINAAQTGFDLATGNLLGAELSILPGIGRKLSRPISRALKHLKYKTDVYELPNNNYNITISERNFLKRPTEIGTLTLEKTSPDMLSISSVSNSAQDKYKRMSEELYNAGIRVAQLKGYKGIVSGRQLMDPKRTTKILDRYQKTLINNSGIWNGKEPEWQGNKKPVYLLQEPTTEKYNAFKLKTNKALTSAIKNDTYLTKRLDQETLDRLGIKNISPEELRSKIESIPIEFGDAYKLGGATYNATQNKIIIDYNFPKSLYGEAIDHERNHALDYLINSSSDRFAGDVPIVLRSRELYRYPIGDKAFTSELSSRLVQLKNKHNLDKNRYITGSEWKEWIESYGKPHNYPGIFVLKDKVKDWNALSKWANKVVPAIIPLELINNKNNGNDNKKMNNAN